MIRLPRRWYTTAAALLLLLGILTLFQRLNESPYVQPTGLRFKPQDVNKLPSTQPRRFHDIQFKFAAESVSEKDARELRRSQVKDVFERAWFSYVQHAWGEDELKPLSGGAASTFGGWGATLVDSLDSLWIMGMRAEFEIAVETAASINFNQSESDMINVFETNIRYLGGFLGAYDVTDGAYPVLLTKAVEVGEVLFKAFDTPNRMPITRWNWRFSDSTDTGERPLQWPSDTTLVAELGSLSLEFTRLSQLTGDSKYYDAIYSIMKAFDRSQQSTKAPGLWPIVVNAQSLSFDSSQFTISGMADSAFEYLPKEYILLGGTVKSYQMMWERAFSAMKSFIFFRPMVPVSARQANADNASISEFPNDSPPESEAAADLLLPGDVHWDERQNKLVREPKVQHLGCFAGGMVALGAKIFGTEATDIPIAQRLVNGCIWAYESLPTGIMPEVAHVVPCEDSNNCFWDEAKWHATLLQWQQESNATKGLPQNEKVKIFIDSKRLPPGYTLVDDPRYILRPEAIESIFVLYRLTGDKQLLDAAWKMFEAIERNTGTRMGNAAIKDVTVALPDLPEKMDRMESFWMAETLKYLFLLYSEPGFISLDKFVL